jgi:hypothetical protein
MYYRPTIIDAFTEYVGRELDKEPREYPRKVTTLELPDQTRRNFLIEIAIDEAKRMIQPDGLSR